MEGDSEQALEVEAEDEEEELFVAELKCVAPSSVSRCSASIAPSRAISASSVVIFTRLHHFVFFESRLSFQCSDIFSA